MLSCSKTPRHDAQTTGVQHLSNVGEGNFLGGGRRHFEGKFKAGLANVEQDGRRYADIKELPVNPRSVPLGFEILGKVDGQYVLYEDPNGTYVLEVNVNRPYGEFANYQRWVELSGYQKVLVKLFPKLVKLLARQTLRAEEKRATRR